MTLSQTLDTTNSETVSTNQVGILPITAIEVADDDRLNFLPAFFGDRVMLQGERAVFSFMKTLCPTYTGGFWDFYTLSNGGGFLGLSVVGTLELVSPNGFSGRVSGEVAGIIATLFALSHLSMDLHMKGRMDDCDHLAERFHALRDYVSGHDQASFIFQVID
jgi:hypothetical protein